MALPLTADQPDRSVAPSERAVARDFILARLGPLFALAPAGVWTAVHLWNQLAAWRSPQAWEISVTGTPAALAPRWSSSSCSARCSYGLYRGGEAYGAPA